MKTSQYVTQYCSMFVLILFQIVRVHFHGPNIQYFQLIFEKECLNVTENSFLSGLLYGLRQLFIFGYKMQLHNKHGTNNLVR